MVGLLQDCLAPPPPCSAVGAPAGPREGTTGQGTTSQGTTSQVTVNQATTSQATTSSETTIHTKPPILNNQQPEETQEPKWDWLGAAGRPRQRQEGEGRPVCVPLLCPVDLVSDGAEARPVEE